MPGVVRDRRDADRRPLSHRRRPGGVADSSPARSGGRADGRGLAARFEPRRALALGFRAEATFDEIIRLHIDDELGGRTAA